MNVQPARSPKEDCGRNENADSDTSRAERESVLPRLFWHTGRTFIHAETPQHLLPALGRVNLEHVAPVPRQSEDQRRVPVAVEAVSMPYGLAIDGEDLVAARKGRRQDQQRRSRQVEIGDQPANELKPVAGADK